MNRIPLPESWRGRAIVLGDVLFSNDWFTDDELAIAASFKLPKRKTEWIHSRIAAKQLAMELGLCASPRDCRVDRPWLRAHDTQRYVSISHSGGYAGAAIDVAPVGIDVEFLREIKESAAHLFLTEAEEAAMHRSRIAHPMLHFWAAKEAAWKRLGGEVEALKRVPLKLEAESAAGLRFDQVETFAAGDLVIALTRPTA
jgi:4'-phosphopantetheinyl transferase EntD